MCYQSLTKSLYVHTDTLTFCCALGVCSSEPNSCLARFTLSECADYPSRFQNRSERRTVPPVPLTARDWSPYSSVWRVPSTQHIILGGSESNMVYTNREDLLPFLVVVYRMLVSVQYLGTGIFCIGSTGICNIATTGIYSPLRVQGDPMLGVQGCEILGA